MNSRNFIVKKAESFSAHNTVQKIPPESTLPKNH